MVFASHMRECKKCCHAASQCPPQVRSVCPCQRPINFVENMDDGTMFLAMWTLASFVLGVLFTLVLISCCGCSSTKKVKDVRLTSDGPEPIDSIDGTLLPSKTCKFLGSRNEVVLEHYIYIPIHGGCAHKRLHCSGMKDPRKVPLCHKCFG